MFRHAMTLATIMPALILSGCTTMRESLPSRTATEQLLISTAADHASDKLQMRLPKGTKAFIDDSRFEATDGKYAAAAIRDALLRQGLDIVDDKVKAQTVVELRSGALSIDQSSLIVGIPSFTVPIPLAGPFTTPELALYGTHQTRGIAKFGAAAYDPATGLLIVSIGPAYGYSEVTERTVFFFISWTKQDILPADKGGLGLARAPRQDNPINPSDTPTTGAADTSDKNGFKVPKL